MGADGAADANKPADGEKGPDGTPAKPGAVTKKMVKIVTVMAYISGVSGAGFLLSLYYIIFWDPNIQGVRPPGYLKSGQRIGLPLAPQALVADPHAGYHRKMSREYMDAYLRNLSATTGEAQMTAEGGVMDSQPTPRVLPLIPEPNYHNGHHVHHNGHTTSTQSNNNYQSSGPSPQQDIPRDSSPSSGSPFVSDDIRKQQEHGQPPLSASD